MRSLGLALALTALAMLPVVAGLESIHVGQELFYGFADGDDLWLGAGKEGVFVVDLGSGDVRHLMEGQGVPVNSTTCGVSAFGRVWLGSKDGLFVRDALGAWSRVGLEHLPSLSLNCLAVQDGSLWVGTTKGVAKYDSSTDVWTTFTAADGLPDSWVISISVLDDLVLFGTMRGGLCEFNVSTGVWRSWRKDDGLFSNTVFSVSASHEHVLAGTTNGFSVLDRRSQTWKSYGSESLPSPMVYATLWDSELGQGWIGTGFGLGIWNPADGTIRKIVKVSEIELEKVNWLAEVKGIIWVLRASNLWFSRRTTSILGFNRTSGRWLRPVVLDVLVDQSGYGPGDRKGFVVQSNEPIAGGGRFYVESLSGGVVSSGVLGSRFDRVDWDAYYWSGDFTPFQRRGNFTIRVEVGNWSGRSCTFEVDNDALIDRCGESIYEFLRYMRCGVAHEYRAKPCHLDDGVLPNGTHIDATGGWHCAGLWGGKWSEYHTYVLFNLLLAYDIRPDFFGAIDRDGDALPDILDEAMWGCEFLLRMQMQDGSIPHEVEKVEQTDGIIGTSDDRKILDWMPTYNGLLAVAGLAGTSALIADRDPQSAARYLDGALLSLRFYGSELAGGLGSSLNGAAMVLACAQLYRATSNSTYLELAEKYCSETLVLPFSEYYGPFVPCALGYYLEINPSSVWRQSIMDYIAGIADSRMAEDGGSSNPYLPFEIPTWRLYILDPWAATALFAYRLMGNRTYLDYGIALVDCHLGVNPYGICMLEGAGTVDPPGYGSSFRTPSNPRGVVPGSIPQGIRTVNDRPYYDISIGPAGESAETWLINTNLLQAISLIPWDRNEYPLEIHELWSALPLLCLILALKARQTRPQLGPRCPVAA